MTKVLVIGGGPGGSTAAALLARSGFDVELIERERFPRYHIGESLASSCRVFLQQSGALEKVDARGYPIKRGALLRWGTEEDWTIDWSRLFGTNVSSWQVEREDFDQVLLDHAAESGVQVREGCSVRRVLFDDDDRPYAAEWGPTDDRAAKEIAHFDYLVDASGRAGVLANQTFKTRRPHEIFRNVAIWGYWQGGKTLPNTPEGGIDVISHPEGWYWVIPLRNDRFSVGFVTHKTHFKERRAGYDSDQRLLLDVIDESDTIKQLLAEGTFDSEVHIEPDYSYVADSFCGPGYFIVGDAACFLDPLLSTGVHLALYSGTLAAASIGAAARGEVTDVEAQSFYESRYRNAYARLLVLVSGVYEQYKGKQSYFWLAQRLVRDEDEQAAVQEPSEAAFVEIVAGLTDVRDATTGATDGVREMIRQARETALAGTAVASGDGEDAHAGFAPLRIEASDLYDAASGLYLVTTPQLGIGRTEAVQPGAR